MTLHTFLASGSWTVCVSLGNIDGSQRGPWVMSVQFILTFYFLWKQKDGELGSRTTRVRKLLQSSKYNKVGIRNGKQPWI